MSEGTQVTEAKPGKKKRREAPVTATYVERVAKLSPYKVPDVAPLMASIADASLKYLRVRSPGRRRALRDALNALDEKLK